MKLNDFYTSFLRAVGLVITQEGYVKLPVMDEVAGVSFPATINKKNLVLPTDENLTKVVGENVIVFHPLNEDLNRGPSKVLEFVRLYSRQELEVQIILLITNVLRLSASTDLHKQLTPDQSTILDVLKGVDVKTLERVLEKFDAIQERLDVNSPDKSLVHIYLRRSGKVEGKAYNQVATVTFPIYELLASGETTILGVKLSKAAAKCLKDIFEYIFPNIADKGAYSIGSNSNIAPKFEAIIGAVATLILQLNTVIALVNTEDAKIFAECELLDTEWMDQIGKFDAMRREITSVPMQRGNEGDVEIGEGGYNTVDVSEGQARPVRTATKPAEEIRKRMATTDTPAWEHESPRKTEPEVASEPTPGSHLKEKPAQPKPQSDEPSSLTKLLRQGQVGMQPPPVGYPVPYAPPGYPAHAAPLGYPPPPQEGGVLAAIRRQAPQAPVYPHHQGPVDAYGFPIRPGPHGLGHEGVDPYAFGYYGQGNPSRRY